MFADLVHLQSLVPMPGTNFEGYTNTDGQYFDGGRDGFDINMGGGSLVHIKTDQYGESTFQCMDHNCMLEDDGTSGAGAYYA
eukprot:CAMPEP_0179415802 /NCGR_PEP_ID=MMETSP0799-20121207/6448_1 /TAXON_ID=46947 /ORGANISM="Geminigera cryophila, Strain CCMP2564" /LENGTH=81 /DNA_ID=CAMNT_0021188609 /DNA_START=280 /DNA_END=525 /DNA_ORIENTATION=+